MRLFSLLVLTTTTTSTFLTITLTSIRLDSCHGFLVPPPPANNVPIVASRQRHHSCLHQHESLATPSMMETVHSTTTTSDATASDTDATDATTAPDTDSTTDSSSSTTPLKRFQGYMNDKLAVSDQVGLDQVDSYQMSPWDLPRYTVSEIAQLVKDAIDEDEDDSGVSNQQQHARQEFAQHLQASGGAILVDLEEHTSTLQTLWAVLGYLFDATPPDDQSHWRHQTLTRNNNAAAHQSSGYQFVQLSLSNSKSRLHGLPAHVGDMGHDAAYEAHQLLADLLQDVAVAALAGSGIGNKDDSTTSISIPEARQWVESILNDPGQRPLSGSYHRLARYIVPPSSSKTTESLRSHGDWTLTTAIPVSSRPGLQLWNARHHNWIAPEQADWWRTTTHGDDDNTNTHARYVVVMTGQWLDLMTRARIPTCLHRVVLPSNGVEPRFSAPFFLRPREALFDDFSALQQETDLTRYFWERYSSKESTAVSTTTTRG